MAPLIDPPCDAIEAVCRARAVVNTNGQYLLGTGNYKPFTKAGKTVDLPWTLKGGLWGTDCAGFAICYAWKLRRARPPFNRGKWATVVDHLNTDSVYEDALYGQALFTVVRTPRPGDLLVYPSVRRDGKRILIGHVGLVEAVPAEWDEDAPQYDLLTVIQSHGPNRRKPGVVRTTGITWKKHDLKWSKHKSAIIRPKERR